MPTDYYNLLSISPQATPKEIKTAYRRMAEVYHPDKLRELPPGVRKEGEEIMRLLNEAKSVLLDPERRAEYDLFRTNADRRTDAIILGEEIDEYDDFVMEIDPADLDGKMKRVLSSMKEVFVRDRTFQQKVSEAEEIVDAQIIVDVEALERSAPKDPPPQEMSLEFAVLSKRAPNKEDKAIPEEERKGGRFKVLAIEEVSAPGKGRKKAVRRV